VFYYDVQHISFNSRNKYCEICERFELDDTSQDIYKDEFVKKVCQTECHVIVVDTSLRMKFYEHGHTKITILRFFFHNDRPKSKTG